MQPQYLRKYARQRREYSTCIDFPGIDFLLKKGMKVAEDRTKKEDILILFSKPSHMVQMRNIEINSIEEIFEKLKRDRADSVISVILLGAPACGKTQLARQYGSKYFSVQKQNQPKFPLIDKKIVIVGTLDVRNESSLWRSYSRLATELQCSVRADRQLKDRLAILKAKVQKRFRENPGWLLIIDGINDNSKITTIMHAVIITSFMAI